MQLFCQIALAVYILIGLLVHASENKDTSAEMLGIIILTVLCYGAGAFNLIFHLGTAN